MKLLGIDYGRRKIGIAVGDDVSRLSQPYSVIRYKTIDQALKTVCSIIDKEEIEKVVVGLSTKEIGDESKDFARSITKVTSIETILVEEFFSTKIAQKLSIEANIKRAKRKEMEDAYSAAVILQTYLDENEFD